MKKSLVILPLFIFSVVFGDLYMHNPRGSNGRLNEANENRNNGARLMDTQNNAKGGYCWGPSMSFYEGSLLSIEWTNQHGCGENTKLKCNLVIQYMCTAKDAPELARVRDGTTTDTIPDNAAGAVTKNANGELLYGMHESFQSYQDCKKRDRNLGLFVADRAKVGGLTPNGRPSAIFTRQNNNGNRNGLECTEERDYYPYWHPTEWRDIAIVTGNTEWCDFYQSESQNVKAKNYCQDKATGNGAQWNNEAACNVNGGIWTEAPSWGISAPACVKAPFQRNNHLGNTVNGQQSHFNWTLPTSGDLDCIAADNCNCVVRMRYNISVGDLGPDGNRPDAGFIDYAKNAEASPVLNDAIMYQDGAAHQLALDTTQYGRTFQDRSHVFHIKPRPDGVLPTNRIFNLNVRGKRGNIVQAYPATEYDFIPTYLFAKVGDYVHFQWTGCDTNPAGNAGEGTDQTDRSNMVQMEAMDRDQPASDEWISNNTPLFESQELRLRMAMLGQTNCLTYEQLKQKTGNNNNAIETDVQNCMKLNAAPAYFDGGLIPMNLTGTFYYMSSRNNNFTNREQKGIIEVIPLLPTWAVVIVVLGAALFVGSAGIAGAMLYAKSHPHSQVANWFSRV